MQRLPLKVNGLVYHQILIHAAPRLKASHLRVLFGIGRKWSGHVGASYSTGLAEDAHAFGIPFGHVGCLVHIGVDVVSYVAELVHKIFVLEYYGHLILELCRRPDA